MAACRVLEEPVGRAASPHGSYTNDLLGNRTLWDVSGSGDPSYEWDLLNRMTKFQGSDAWSAQQYVEHQYRADGMRVRKTNTWASPTEVTKYFYDGQMGIEDVWDDGTDELVTRYGIGARGIEVISKIENGGSETFGFPLYDTHGNMLATLGRSGSSYTTGNWQSYDVWGSVRSGSSSEQQGYVANLGHRADPESFLTYMRARYYEPMTGRFVSQDPARYGSNWFVYASNMPSALVDSTGRWPEDDSFDPIYFFNMSKWTMSYWINIATLPIRLIIAFALKGWAGVAVAASLFAVAFGFHAMSIVELYSIRIMVWMAFLFDEEEVSGRDLAIVSDAPIVGFWKDEPTASGGGSW